VDIRWSAGCAPRGETPETIRDVKVGKERLTGGGL